MSILHVVESLERGGLERVVVDLATEQKALGRDVAVCCLFRRGILADELEALGIAVYVIGKSKGFDLGAVMRLRKLMRKLGADIIHTHNAVANYYSALACLFNTRLRLVNTRHGMGETNANGKKEKLYRISLMRTSAVVAVCAHAANRFFSNDLVPERLLNVVHNGIRVEKFAEVGPESRERIRSSLGISRDALVVGTVGRLNWAKDHAMLVESFAALERSRSDRLVIVGGGELRDKLDAHVARLGLEEQVMFLGDRSDIPELLAAFDIFALTSVTEGYSIALLEAAAAGLAMVVSDVGGNSEIVHHELTGLLVEPRTVDAFASVLRLLATDSNARLRLGHGAAQWAQRNASLGSMVRAYDFAYKGQALPAASSGGTS